jgi:hypothetical protein
MPIWDKVLANGTATVFVGRGKTLIILVDPKQIVRLRFDPAQSAITQKLPRLSVAPLETIDEVRSLIRSQAQTEDEVVHMLNLLRPARRFRQRRKLKPAKSRPL